MLRAKYFPNSSTVQSLFVHEQSISMNDNRADIVANYFTITLFFHLFFCCYLRACAHTSISVLSFIEVRPSMPDSRMYYELTDKIIKDRVRCCFVFKWNLGIREADGSSFVF